MMNIAAWLTVLAAVSWSSANACDRLIVEMPEGWWRVHIETDGSGIMAFGAAPQTVRFPPNTLDMAAVEKVMRAEGKETTSKGRITCMDGEAGKTLFIGNGEFAHRLFKRAWAERSTPENEIENWNEEALGKLWNEEQMGDLLHEPKL